MKINYRPKKRKLEYAEMVQMAHDYNAESNGKPKYKVRELLQKYGISEPTFFRYLKKLQKTA